MQSVSWGVAVHTGVFGAAQVLAEAKAHIADPPSSILLHPEFATRSTRALTSPKPSSMGRCPTRAPSCGTWMRHRRRSREKPGIGMLESWRVGTGIYFSDVESRQQHLQLFIRTASHQVQRTGGSCLIPDTGGRPAAIELDHMILRLRAWARVDARDWQW